MTGVSRSALVLHDGASLSYLTAGMPSDDPVLLIHGSTETAESDWFVHSPMRSRLAELGYFVIAPVCRGHGRSTASRDDFGWLVYSFEQMAAEGAELLRALGMPRAFRLWTSQWWHGRVSPRRVVPIAGPGGGGLGGATRMSTSMSAPASPSAWTLDRVDRENASWRNAMISLHDTFHGEGYWRERLEGDHRRDHHVSPLDGCGPG